MNEAPQPQQSTDLPPDDGKQRCVMWRCGKELGPGKEGRTFCPDDWKLVPAHIQDAINGELAWLKEQKVGPDQGMGALLNLAVHRAVYVKCKTDPEFKKQVDDFAASELQRRKDEALKASARASGLILPGDSKASPRQLASAAQRLKTG